jgi:predicted PhzF superfamily epimerase YddE/YHI9
VNSGGCLVTPGPAWSPPELPGHPWEVGGRAGHPTLGTARAWLDAGGVPRTPGRVVQECGAGLVPVRIDDDALAFAGPPQTRSGPVDV